MRITGPSGTGVTANTRETRRSTSGSFTLNTPDPTPAAKAPAAPNTLGGIDALIALQGVEEPTERRRRAIKRGRYALDALDELSSGCCRGRSTPPPWCDLRPSSPISGTAPATARSMRCWPRSACGSRSRWPSSARRTDETTAPNSRFGGACGCAVYRRPRDLAGGRVRCCLPPAPPI